MKNTKRRIEPLSFFDHTGWQLACTSAQLQIFYNERENPIPIETDPELELQAIHASYLLTVNRFLRTKFESCLQNGISDDY